MKSLTIASLILVTTIAQAKPMPSVETIQARLDASGLTKVGKWETIDTGIRQFTQGATVVVTPEGFAAGVELVGSTDDELHLSFLNANNVCVEGALESIDMAQNSTLRQSMRHSFDSALTAYNNKADTLVWGYHFKTELAKNNDSTFVICGLR